MTADRLPEDMPLILGTRLKHDIDIYGTALYEETGDGYERIAPAEYVLIPNDPPEGVEIVADRAPTDYYGTPDLRATYEATARDVAARRYNRLFFE